MKWFRMFSNEKYKGTKGYLDSQKKYELARTILYFTITIAIFITGFVTTKTRLNLLTVVAALGSLPACKSLVEMIMFFKFHSLKEDACQTIEAHTQDLDCLYDLVFTSYDKNYSVGHLCVRAGTLCGYTDHKDFDENGFHKHINTILMAENMSNVTIKIFKDLDKYVNRVDQLKSLNTDKKDAKICETLKSVSL